MTPPTPLIFSEAHRGHADLVEVLAGREIPCWESPARAETILTALLATGDFVLEQPQEHGPDAIAAVHELELIDLVENAWTDAVADGHDPARSLLPDTFLLDAYRGPMALGQLPSQRHLRLGAYCFDTATPMVAGTAAAARAAVDVALTAVDRVLDFNNAAIAAQSMRDRGAERVAILDVDFHHGNGTQQLFWERGDVLYVSLHGDPRVSYPYYSGFATERGAGDGEGATLNFPLPPATDGEGYLATLDEAVAAIRAFDADAPLVVSLGFDTYETDPIGSFALRTGDYARMGALVSSLRMPAVVLQEGGYAVDAIGRNAVAFLGALRDG